MVANMDPSKMDVINQAKKYLEEAGYCDRQEKHLRPVCYLSKKTTEAEARYTSYKLELMAVAYALDKLRNLLYGRKFTVVTDCAAVTHAYREDSELTSGEVVSAITGL